jgi:predicted nucleotidyltransferase
MSLYADMLEKRDDILRIAAGHGAVTVRLFGSVVRGEETPESDIDLLVECEPGRRLLDHVALVQDQEDLLGRTVDVVTKGGLHRYIRDCIHRETVPL